MKKNLNIIAFALVILAGSLMGCQEDYYFDGGLSDGKLNVTTYDFLLEKQRYFDTLLWVIDENNLKDQVNAENSTFFAPQNGAFKLFFDKLELDPVPKSLEELPASVKDTLGLLLKKYMISEEVMRKDIPVAGKLESVNANGEPVSVFFLSNPRGGIPGFGPKDVVYGATVKVPNINTGVPEEQERVSVMSTTDLESTNGVVHVVAVSFTFGF